jgi:DNA polymerase I-like protein with 3'-5' exonuclease and polymerase domains
MSKLLEWFGTPGVDVHIKNAIEVFGFDMAGEMKKENRQLAKTAAYLLNYGGSPQKLHRTMLSDFPHLKLEQVEQFDRQWKGYHHELVAYHNAMCSMGATKGYVETPIFGWRREVNKDRVKLQEVSNFPVQNFAAILMNKSLLHFMARKPARDIVLAQVHDSLLVECDDPQATGALLTQCMQQTYAFPAGEMEFKVEAQVGDSWGKLTPLHV